MATDGFERIAPLADVVDSIDSELSYRVLDRLAVGEDRFSGLLATLDASPPKVTAAIRVLERRGFVQTGGGSVQLTARGRAVHRAVGVVHRSDT